MRLGDLVERLLSAVGITPARWAAWFGKEACLPCARRKSWLNRLFAPKPRQPENWPRGRPILSCIHRGRQLPAPTCAPCSEDDKVPVFGCARYGNCTLAQQIGTLPTCQGCENRRER